MTTAQPAHETEVAKYMRAMIAGRDDTCGAIERVHGLFGYPPEMVTIALKAFDEGRDPDEALEAYINGDDEEDVTA